MADSIRTITKNGDCYVIFTNFYLFRFSSAGMPLESLSRC